MFTRDDTTCRGFLITQRLPDDKNFSLLSGSANGGCLFQSRPGVQRYAASYRVQAA
jgi:hypothetical protein